MNYRMKQLVGPYFKLRSPRFISPIKLSRPRGCRPSRFTSYKVYYIPFISAQQVSAKIYDLVSHCRALFIHGYFIVSNPIHIVHVITVYRQAAEDDTTSLTNVKLTILYHLLHS